MRETEVEDGSLGTVTPADFGFTIRGFTVDIGICCLRSVDRIPRLSSRAVKKDEYSIEAAADTLRERRCLRSLPEVFYFSFCPSELHNILFVVWPLQRRTSQILCADQELLDFG